MIYAVQGSSDQTTAQPTGSELSADSFLTLLVAQLQSQSPFDPVDPKEFVNQLVQFNMLAQMIGIRKAVEQGAAGQDVGTQPVSVASSSN